ncbi:MAG: hypothetical protein K9N52_07145 [Verrucomicrobia bacterium]|nr:hypothetical protein [Verrucomicrobiota bacterium]
MIIRSVGKILRGDATPFQIMAACILSSVLAFMPGFTTAPGVILLSLLLLIIINANLALAALLAGVLKLVSLLVMPVTFALGRFFLEGPASGIFKWAVNAPVLAWFGFEYYVVTGGLVMGLVLGIAAGLFINRIVLYYRKKASAMKEGSAWISGISKSPLTRFMLFLLIGGKSAERDGSSKRKLGKVIRPMGVIFVVVCALLILIVKQFATDAILASTLQSSLERINGATVDVGGVHPDLKNGRITILNLALADPERLDTDIFRAQRIVADIGGMELLRKRVTLDSVVMTDASSGKKRKAPGHLIGPAEKPEERRLPKPEPPKDVKTLDDYLENAELWRARLEEVKKWLDKIPEPRAPDEEAVPEKAKEKLSDRLAARIREKGYTGVRALHLMEGKPALTVSEVRAEEVDVTYLEPKMVNLVAENLSTHPSLMEKPPRIHLNATDDTLEFELVAGRFASVPTNNMVSFTYLGLPADSIAGVLRSGDERLIGGGTIDLNARGQLFFTDRTTMDIPLNVTLRNTTLSVGGSRDVKVDRFDFNIGIRGELASPGIYFDSESFFEGLAKAGVNRVAGELKDKVQEEVGDEIKKRMGEQGGSIFRGVLDNLGERVNKDQSLRGGEKDTNEVVEP